jgi:tetraacyldisaccharide 4'-kinase
VRPPHPLALGSLLRLLALGYGAAIRLRNGWYDRGLGVHRVGIPVISVGNLTVGGTGKTPLVAWLAARLVERRRRPAVVSRGYRGRAGRGPLVVSDGSGPRSSVAVCGDEPFLLARSLVGVPVVVGSDRVAGAEAAHHLGADVILLDDGFQHRRLARDLDLVLLDSSNPFGNDALLPAGLLREPPAALARADVVVVTRSSGQERFTVIEQAVRHHNPRAPLVRAGHRALGFFDRHGRAVAPPSLALAFCAIGNPSRFRSDLEGAGVRVARFETRRDHDRFSDAEVLGFADWAAAHGTGLVTTEKDWVRFADPTFGGRVELHVLRIEAVVYDPDPLVQAMERVLEESA